MTRPRRHTPEQAAAAQRAVDDARPTIEFVESFRDDPCRASRNPCDNPDCSLHWADPEAAAHVRRTGLQPGRPSAPPPRPWERDYRRSEPQPEGPVIPAPADRSELPS